MKTYRVTFKPMEPYFFGNEKGFLYPSSGKGDSQNSNPLSNQYFIKSESVPSQSTILGALRYLLLPVKRSDWKYSDDDLKKNADAVGANGFHPLVKQGFGKIKKISPVFLYDGDDILVVAPLDHVVSKSQYTPFAQYQTVSTPNGDRRITSDYNVKDGITSGYMKLCDGTVVPLDKIFRSVTRTGINREVDNKGYFKKEYRILDAQYAFGVYLSLEDDLIPHDDVVFLGQGKSAFSVQFTPEENSIDARMKSYLREDVIYCAGDVFADATVYDKSLFAVTKNKTYRVYQNNSGRVKKDSVLYRLLAAGSIFIPQNKDEFLATVRNENVNQIGFNEFITK